MQNSHRTGLSVADPVTVRRGRPWMGIAIVVSVVAVAGVLVASLVAAVHPHDARDARVAARNAVTMIAAAEAGDREACVALPRFVAGPRATVLRECRAVVGDDAGAELHGLEARTAHIAAERGTVHLTGTLVRPRDSGTLAVDVDITETGGRWQLSWDGTSVLH